MFLFHVPAASTTAEEINASVTLLPDGEPGSRHCFGSSLAIRRSALYVGASRYPRDVSSSSPGWLFVYRLVENATTLLSTTPIGTIAGLTPGVVDDTAVYYFGRDMLLGRADHTLLVSAPGDVCCRADRENINVTGVRCNPETFCIRGAVHEFDVRVF